MNSADFDSMSSAELVAFYNKHSDVPVKRFSDRKTAIRRCSALELKEEPEAKKPRPNMVASLKLDRTITCEQTGGVWDNAHHMWVENRGWMTSGQQDRLTSQLYTAAKKGEQRVVTINERSFKLVNVGAC